MRNRRAFRKLFNKTVSLYFKAFRIRKKSGNEKVLKLFTKAEELRKEIIIYRGFGLISGDEYAVLYHMVYYLVMRHRPIIFSKGETNDQN